MVTLEVFGGPKLIRAGQTLKVTPSHLTLLLLLAERKDPGLSRQFASDLLWPLEKESVVRHRFSQLLYTLNRRVGDGVMFAVSDEMVSVQRGQLASDLEDFQRLLLERDLWKAHTLLEAGYAPSLDSGCPEAITNWLEGRRIELRAALRRRAASSWFEAEGSARWEDAGTAAEVMLELDPNDESALQHLIWARSVQGRVAEARAAFRSFVERAKGLTGDADWSPTQDTLDLVSRARAIGEAHARGESDSLEPHPPPRMVGRDSELAELARAVRRVPSGNLQVVLVSGEGGIGKTRLLHEASKVLPGLGITLLSTSSSEFAREIQLGPILEALSTTRGRRAFNLLQEPWKTVVLGLLPDFHDGDGPIPQPPPLQAGAVPRRLFEAIRQILLRLSDESPIVLLLDDAQWLDETSAAALDYLRRRWDSGSLTVVLADRPESRIPGSAADRLLTFLHGKVPGIVHLELGPLRKDDALSLVSGTAGLDLEQGEAERILALAGENPFFLVEITRAHVAGGVDRAREGTIPVPRSVENLLRPQIDRLSEDAKRILMLMAVHPEPLEPRAVGSLVQCPREACLEALEELTDSRLLRWDRERASVQHALIRETVYESLSPGRLSWLHGRVATYLRDRAEAATPDQLALHFHRAGIRLEALSYALDAARLSEESGGVQEAIQFLYMALEDCQEEDQETEILYRLGTLLHQAGRYRPSLDALRSSSVRLREAKQFHPAFRAEITAADAMSMLEDESQEEAIGQLRRLREDAQGKGFWEPNLLAWDTELHIRHRMGDKEGANALLQEVRQLEVPPSPLEQSIKESILSISLHYGDPWDSIAHASAGYAWAKQAGQNEQRMRALSRFVMVHSHQALLASNEGESALEDAKSLAAGAGALQLRALLWINRGVWFLDAGMQDRALLEFEQVRRVLKETHAPNLHVLLHYNLGETLLGLFHYEAALAHFKSAEELTKKRVAPLFAAAVSAGIGMAALLTGDLGEARSRLSMLPPPADREHFDSSLLALFEARMWMKKGRIEAAETTLEEACTQVRNRWVTAWLKLAQEHASILGRRNPPLALERINSLRNFAQERGLSAKDRELSLVEVRLRGEANH